MKTCLAAALAFASVASAAPRPYFTEPCLSPDNKEIAFVSGGDIWTAPASGGEAHLLVSHPATESRPLYSPDGARLAFLSTRTGNGDIYVLTLATGELKQITYDDGPEQLDGWSRDGKYLYFSTTAHDISSMNDIYRVKSTGGTPMPVSADRYANEYFSAPAPNGSDLALTARGIVSAQWWRKGHSHLDQSEIYIRREGSPARYERVSDGTAKELWPMWNADGLRLYYVSDKSGVQNIWEYTKGVKKQITRFTDGRVLWPTIAWDGKTIVFEHDFEIWQMDTAKGETRKIGFVLRGASSGPSQTHLTLTNGLTELELSKDGKKLAFIVHGEVFATGSKEGGNAFRVTHTAANERSLKWAPDNNRIAYVSDREGPNHIFEYDFKTNKEQRITQGTDAEEAPNWSPDGKFVAYLRGSSELHVVDLATHEDKSLAKDYFRGPGRGTLAWSPDSKWIAYFGHDDRYFGNIMLVDRSGGKPQPASFLGNVFGGRVAWSPDGVSILFTTGQRTELASVARIDLIPKTPRFREDQFRDLFATPTPKEVVAEEKATPAKKDVKIVFENIRQRLSLLPSGLDVQDQVISPDGKQLLLTAVSANQSNLYTYSLDELALESPVARQLTSTPGAKSYAQWSPDGKDIYFLEGGRPASITLESRITKPISISAELDVDFSQEKLQVFHQAWSALNDGFYDPAFHGVDWPAMRERYEPLIEGSRTPDEMRRITGLMIGELNASHSGIAAAAAEREQPVTGRIGVQFDRDTYESSGQLKVAEVIDLSPAAIAGIRPGDLITAIDGRPVSPSDNFDDLMRHKVNRRTTLSVSGRELNLRPANSATEKNLLYRQWVEQRRAYVSKISNGKLGYVHMIDMSEGSLQRLMMDLDADNRSKEGVVVDVRNNNGGFVNAYALDVLTRRGYLNMTDRGFKSAPARSILGQRSLELPTILVTNQHSLSDAEDFTEGYRAMKLGEVVGEPTAGWIIFTNAVQLVDGSSVRMPFSRITTADGSDMEGHPRPVDTFVLRPIGESYTGKDIQLETAVEHLLQKTTRHRTVDNR